MTNLYVAYHEHPGVRQTVVSCLKNKTDFVCKLLKMCAFNVIVLRSLVLALQNCDSPISAVFEISVSCSKLSRSRTLLSGLTEILVSDPRCYPGDIVLLVAQIYVSLCVLNILYVLKSYLFLLLHVLYGDFGSVRLKPGFVCSKSMTV